MKIFSDVVRKKSALVLAMVCGFCTSCTFFMKYEACQELTLDTNNRLYYYLYCFLEEMKNACIESEISLSLGMVCFSVFYLWFFRHSQYHVKVRFKNCISVLFSFCGVTGIIILKEITWKSPGQLIKLCIAFVGGYLFYGVIIQILYIFLRNEHQISFWFIPKKIKKVFWKRPGIFSTVGLLCCWSIPIILKYPAGICVDVARQLDQGLGYIPLTAHHPVVHTMLMSWFVRLGRSMGSANLGIFLFCLVEAVVLAAIFGFIISVLIRLSARKWVIVISLLFFAFSPYITGYVGTPIKDIYFTAMVCIYIAVLYVYSIEPVIFWGEKKYLILFILSAIGMALFRNNGIYICFLTGIALLVHEVVKRRKRVLVHATIILLSIIMAFSSSKIVNYIYDPVPGSIREALSLPFQQTARYVTQYGDEVTAEEKEAINKILPYNKLAELYNPYISDPVKNRYNDEADKEDLKKYFQVWFQQFVKHPKCYVESVYQQNIFLLCPMYNNYIYYLDTTPFERIDASTQDIKTPKILEKIQVIYRQTLELSHKLPILNLINNMALYIMLLIVLCAFAITDKKYSHLFYYLPLLVSVLVIIAAPCIRGHVRYAYPIIYTFPVWLAGITRKEKLLTDYAEKRQ